MPFRNTWRPWKIARKAQRPAKSRCKSCPASPASTISKPSALEKAGFSIIRQGKHILMSDGNRQVSIPRHNPVKAFMMGGIAQDAGLTPEEFRKLL
jgi:hypothetical protein